MEPDTNLYSPNENNEIIRENSQKILSVLAAHQIALWEYDIPTGKCSFTDDYFRMLGLKEAGGAFKDIDDFSIRRQRQMCIRDRLRSPRHLRFRFVV